MDKKAIISVLLGMIVVGLINYNIGYIVGHASPAFHDQELYNSLDHPYHLAIGKSSQTSPKGNLFIAASNGKDMVVGTMTQEETDKLWDYIYKIIDNREIREKIFKGKE